MTYSDLTGRLVAYLSEDASTDTDWATALPEIIQDAELRIYRDLDLLSVRKTAAVTLSGGMSQLAAPSDWMLGQGVRLTATNAALDRRDVSFLNDYGGSGTPKYWAEPTQGILQFAPVPNTTIQAELSYHYRPTALSGTNTSTWMSANLPDLLFSACMVAAAGYLKNYGAQADDPRSAMSWERVYQTQLAAAKIEEARRKGDNAFDSSPAPPPPSNLPGGGQ